MNTKIDISRYDIMSTKIPSVFDRFKIAHISDIHSRPAHGTAEIIDSEKPDIIAITGDIVHDGKIPVTPAYELIGELIKIAPVYFITGNHDVWRTDLKRIFGDFCDMGAVFLDNSRAEIERGGEKISLYGVSDPFSKLPKLVSRNIKTAFSQLPEFNGYKILMFHRANLFDEIKEYDFDLILSGHMHGGQIRIPRLGGVLAPSSALLSGKRMFFPKYTAGRVDLGGKTMIINRGISNTLPVPRLGNRPEIGIITLNVLK
ncbi:MAG: metallophosphoesterase [Clostridiales bacterium]|nr:metallophosphoesterase [Clostridiales bacterium]